MMTAQSDNASDPHDWRDVIKWFLETVLLLLRILLEVLRF